jgi:2-oxoglutarate/2-oxoacid ferredoxin oxidoreductase subunit beta
VLLLEHGKPLIFGKNRDKGLRLGAGGSLEVVSLGNGTSETDVLVHDERNRSLAYMLAHLSNPTPIGVFHAMARPVYEEAMARQVDAARQKQGDGDINALFKRGETWVVE